MIFFDIETAPIKLDKEIVEKTTERYWEKINFMPEFNQIVSIAVWQKVGRKNVVKSIKWNEKKMIETFYKLVKWNRICGFNIRNFDIPFIVKRGLYHKLPVPDELKFFWKKPWETEHIIDLFEIYKCNVWGAAGNMWLVTDFIWVTNPKDAWVDWWMVADMYEKWEIERIHEYCRDDVQWNIDVYDYFKTYNLI